MSERLTRARALAAALLRPGALVPLLAMLFSLFPVSSTFAGVHELLNASDNSTDVDSCAAPNDVLMVTITTNSRQGGNDASATLVSVGGTVAPADVAEIRVYYDVTLVGSVTNPGSLSNVSISLPGNQKGGKNWTYRVILNATAGGKNFDLTVHSITGTDNAVLPFTTATRNSTSCAGNDPTASAGDITGADDPLLPGIQYQFSAVYSDGDGSSDLADLYMAIDRDGAGTPGAPDDIVAHVTQGGAASGTATVDAGSGFVIGSVTYTKTEGSPTANDITVTWTFTLDWDWHDDEPTVAEYGVRATDDGAADSGWALTNINVDYENDLDLTGTLSVSAADNGPVTCGSTWVHGSETVTWSGLTVFYEGYGTSPANVDFDIRITDDDTGTWTQTAGAALSLATTSDAATDVSDIHAVDVVNIPSTGTDVSTVTCEVKVDATLPETLAGVAAGSPTSSSITVNWTAYGGGDTGAVGDSLYQTYRVYYSTSTPVTTADPVWDSGDDATLATSTTATTTISGLSSSTPYWFRVVGLDQAENEALFSAAQEVTATTQAGANNTPTATAAEITGADDPLLAGVQYQITTVHSDADGASQLADLHLAIDRDGLGTPGTPNDIVVHTTQGLAATGTATVDSGIAFLDGSVSYDKTEGSPTANDITITWTFTLGWNWWDDEPTVAEYGVRATDDVAADSGWDFTGLAVDYENDLDLTGSLTVTATDNGVVTCGSSWVHGAESLTWTGLTAVYQGYGTSPDDADFDIQITDDDAGSWTQATGAALNLGTTTDAATDISDVHSVQLISIPPPGADDSNVTCEVKVDATLPETLAGVTASLPSSSSITIGWTAYGGGDTGAVGDSGFQTYRVYYSTSTPVTTADPVWDSGQDAGLSSSAATTTTVSGLSPATPYYFRVVGRDEAENEAPIGSAQQVTETTQAGAQDGTTVLSNAVIASSCQQLTVTTIFTGDANENGTTLVEYNTINDFTGGQTVACSSLAGPSPRQCLVTKRSDNTFDPGSYFVRVSHTDGDGVFGAPANPQVLSTTLPSCGADPASPTTLILVPARDAIVSGLDLSRVQIYDDAGTAGLTVEWSIDGDTLSSAVTLNTNYRCAGETDTTLCAIYEFDLDTTVLSNGDHYLTVQVTDGAGNVSLIQHGFRSNNKGAGTLLRRTAGAQLCTDCHNLPTHSSRSTSTDYGSWAVDCLACHTPHRTKNVYLIEESLSTPSSGVKSVKFHYDDRATETNPGSAPGDFSFLGDRSDPGGAGTNSPYDDGICEACHTKTKFWRNTSDQDHAHNAGVRCIKCHSHEGGFFGGGGGCLGCHANPGDPGTATGRRPVLTDFANFTGGSEPRSHHVGDGGTAGGQLTDFDCVVCHAEGKVSGGETQTVGAYHGGDGGSKTIDLKDADLWDDANPQDSAVFVYDKAAVATSAGAAANWHSGDQIWREWTSGVDESGGATLPTLPAKAGLDPFCLSCHDSDGALNSFNATDSGTALNPFGDTVITNEYDQVPRAYTDPPTGQGRVVDIKSMVTAGGSDLDTDAGRQAQNINDPVKGIYSRHAIRGQAESTYVAYQNLPSVCGDAANESCYTMYEGDPTAGTSLLTSMGTGEDGSPLWNDTSVMGCGDCHTVDGANGSLGNTHGSDSEYLLKDASGTANEGTLSGLSYVCYRCHVSGRYVPPTGALGKHTDSSSDWQDKVDLTGIDRKDDGKGSNIFGMACTNCHGGTGPDDAGAVMWGTIHGSSEVFGTGDDGNTSTREAYRFMNGASLRYYDPEGWSTSTFTCYTLGTADSWGGCTQHDKSSGPDFDRPLQRPIAY